MRMVLSLGTVILLALAPVADVWADDAKPSAARENAAMQRIAFGGADPVSYFFTSAPVSGLPEHSFEWEGQVYLFASAQNRETFAAQPSKFIPNFEGYCPYSLAQGELVTGNPEIYSLHEGKLYFFRDETARSLWEENPQTYQPRAEAVWQSRQRNQSPYEPKVVVPF